MVLNNIGKALTCDAVTVLLGAGASRSCGVPLTREFLPLVYYLTYFNKYELERTGFSPQLEETIKKLCDSCLEVAESFSRGITISLGHKDLDNKSIQSIVEFFFEMPDYRREADQFLKQTSREDLRNLFGNVSLLTPYEKAILKEYLDRLMFLLGRSLMKGESIPKEIMLLFPNIEDLMSCFDINFLISTIPPIRNLYENIEIIEDEKSMYHAIMAVLCIATGRQKSPLRSKNKVDEEPYKTLARFAKKRKETTFITFNYDTLLDNQLQVLDVPFTYRLNIQNRGNPSNVGCRVLKLHGSSNIWQCRNCQNNFLFVAESLEEYCNLLEEEQLEWKIPGIQCCKNPELFPLIVPPTMLKLMNNLSLTRLWIDAETALEQSQTVIFVGYSFPKEDIMARNLIRSTLLRARELKYVIYINRNPNPLSFIEEVLVEKESKPEVLAFTNEEGLAEERIPILFDI